MKKKLNIIVLLTLVVLTLFTFGCKKEVEAGEEVRGWNIYAQDGACGDKVVTLKVENGEIPWFCWTVHQADGGYIQTAGTDYNIYEYSDSDKTDHMEGDPINDIEELENGKTYVFKFNVARVYDLYIHQPTAEKSANGTKDFRGKVKVEGNTVHLKDSGYKDITGKNVEVYIKNNEPTGSSLWQGGNYVITELWPLIPTQQNGEGSWITGEGSVWSVNQSLKYTNLSLSNSYSAGWLFPMEEGKSMIIAMYQPKRSDGATRPTGKTEVELNENLNSVFGTLFEYTEDREYNDGAEKNSSEFGARQFLKDGQVFTAKSALGTIDYYTVSDVPEGMTK